MRSSFTNSLTILTLLALGTRGEGQGPPAGFSLETLTKGVVSNSCAMAFAPDGRLFITERNTGVIRILDHGKLGGIWAQVGTITSTNAEAGLLGIAIDPDFLRNGYVYVFYTRPSSPRWVNVVARMKDAGGKGTQLTILSPATPATGNHPGGPLEFGPDGKLYVCMGEGGIARSRSRWAIRSARFCE